jgi:RNA polymerase sigma-70 factor (ECF subfamily)
VSRDPLHINENGLVKKISEGDEQAFALLYEEYRQSLHAFIVKLVKSPEMAEDIAQEVFIKVWEHRLQLDQVQSFRAYLFIVARNHTINVLKRIAWEDAAKAEVTRHFRILRAATADSEEAMLSKEYSQMLVTMLASLPDQSRKVFRLCREENKSYGEVATLLGISRNAVKKHMVRSMKIFRDSLGAEFMIILSFLLQRLL